MTRGRALVSAIVLAAAASGCASAPAATAKVNVLDARIDRANRPTYMGLPLKTGQVIVSEAPGAYSFFFSLVPERFFNFTHAGVIVMEGGEPFVYDVSGRYKPGFDDRPTDAIVGGARRQALLDYCRPNLYAEIYEPPPGTDREKIGAWLRERYEKGVVFDPYFRSDEHEKLYCTEFVGLALEAGGAKPVPLVGIRRNPSLDVVLRYLAVPLDEALPAALFIAPERYAGAIGTFPTRTQAYCYFEAKREIYRRFTPDQKVGNIFVNVDGDLALHGEILGFLEAAVKLFEGSRTAPSLAAISLAVRELADHRWGPVAEAAAAPGAVPAALPR